MLNHLVGQSTVRDRLGTAKRVKGQAPAAGHRRDRGEWWIIGGSATRLEHPGVPAAIEVVRGGGDPLRHDPVARRRPSTAMEQPVDHVDVLGLVVTGPGRICERIGHQQREVQRCQQDDPPRWTGPGAGQHVVGCSPGRRGSDRCLLRTTVTARPGWPAAPSA